MFNLHLPPLALLWRGCDAKSFAAFLQHSIKTLEKIIGRIVLRLACLAYHIHAETTYRGKVICASMPHEAEAPCVQCFSQGHSAPYS